MSCINWFNYLSQIWSNIRMGQFLFTISKLIFLNEVLTFVDLSIVEFPITYNYFLKWNLQKAKALPLPISLIITLSSPSTIPFSYRIWGAAMLSSSAFFTLVIFFIEWKEVGTWQPYTTKNEKKKPCTTNHLSGWNSYNRRFSRRMTFGQRSVRRKIRDSAHTSEGAQGILGYRVPIITLVGRYREN